MSSKTAMFILGGPGSGKDYVINNILNRFGLVEVQIDQLLNGSARRIVETGANLLINSNADLSKIELAKKVLEGYSFRHTLVSVSNKVSRERNESRDRPLNEVSRIRKWLDSEHISNNLESVFTFKNSINLMEATKTELTEFQTQIADYLGFLLESGLLMERQLEGTDEYRKHAIAMTPGQGVIKPATLSLKSLPRKKKIVPADNINMRIDGSGGYSLGGLTGTVGESKSVSKFAAWQRNEGKK